MVFFSTQTWMGKNESMVLFITWKHRVYAEAVDLRNPMSTKNRPSNWWANHHISQYKWHTSRKNANYFEPPCRRRIEFLARTKFLLSEPKTRPNDPWSYYPESETQEKYRDLVGALNMLHILWILRHTGGIPLRFRNARLAPATDIPVQLPLNHTWMCENGKSDEVYYIDSNKVLT
jgi:hypothetical protein